jgi:type VI secretion system Hcp family effector
VDKKNNQIFILKIKSIPGECKVKGFEGGILIRKWSTGYDFPEKLADLTGGNVLGVANRTRHRCLTLSKPLDISGTALIENLWKGKIIDEGTLYCLNDEKEYLRIELKDILINKIDVTADADDRIAKDAPEIEISLSYNEITMNCRTDERSGDTRQGSKEISFNVLEGI